MVYQLFGKKQKQKRRVSRYSLWFYRVQFPSVPPKCASQVWFFSSIISQSPSFQMPTLSTATLSRKWFTRKFARRKRSFRCATADLKACSRNTWTLALTWATLTKVQYYGAYSCTVMLIYTLTKVALSPHRHLVKYLTLAKSFLCPHTNTLLGGIGSILMLHTLSMGV